MNGIALSRRLYEDHVRALVGDIPHAAGLLDQGSEVIGFDTEMSMDHDWGPRVQLLFEVTPDLGKSLQSSLPRTLAGRPVFFGKHDDGALAPDSAGPIHRVEVVRWDDFALAYLGCVAPRTRDWLLMPQQRLLTVTTGPLFHDGIGLLARRAEFAWYPEDVAWYLLGCLWSRIGQDEHLMGRAGFVGDEVGASIIGARLARDVIRLTFMLERRYAPYSKWLGSAFARLAGSALIAPHLEELLWARGWEARNGAFARAMQAVIDLQAGLGVLPWSGVKRFHQRPFWVAEHGNDFAHQCFSQIEGAEVRSWLQKPPFGSVDLLSDSTDVAEHPRELADWPW